MINEYDTKGLRSNNFEAHRKAIESLSIVDIVRIVDYVDELCALIPSEENEVLDYRKWILEPFGKITDELRTEKECPKCGCYLFKSDLPQYGYVCAECDQNF